MVRKLRKPLESAPTGRDPTAAFARMASEAKRNLDIALFGEFSGVQRPATEKQASSAGGSWGSSAAPGSSMAEGYIRHLQDPR
jgi:hypothetical protein